MTFTAFFRTEVTCSDTLTCEEQYEEECQLLKTDLFLHLGKPNWLKSRYKIMIFVSFLVSLLHGLLILSSKKMRESRNGFYMMMLDFLEAGFFCNFFMTFYACDIHLP